ncbi:magnesium chelatase [Spirochaetota bacterium]
MEKVKTFGELKSRVKRLPTVREEMRENLIKKLKAREELFPGIVGYDDTVKPALINAIMCGHNIIILGERGQGKTRIIRSMIDFLDDEIPVISGCPINDDPFKPICEDCKEKIAEMGDKTPISYMPRDKRLVEKLATSDVSTADLIGEVDPIKISQGRTLDDETAIHFGLVPRAHRSIFAINELPDLAEKIQVAFFNIMEENDFQIKGFPVRLPLDILIIATANPEDYTNRGRIITPLKDRFDVQVRTHFPGKREHEIQIMDQESRVPNYNGSEIYIPEFIKKILAETTFQARLSPDISQVSGVSCRVSIRSLEAIMGNALRRNLEFDEKRAVPRITDIRSTYPAIIGKLEVEYETEFTDEFEIIDELSRRSIKIVFDEYFNGKDMSSILDSFDKGSAVEISDSIPSGDYMKLLKSIDGMEKSVKTIADIKNPAEVSSAIEFILDGLHQSNLLNKEEKEGAVVYR